MRDGRFQDYLMSIGRRVSRQLVQAVYPASCAGCGLPGEWFCSTCLNRILDDNQPGCIRCGRRGARRRQCERCRSLFPDRLVKLRGGFRFDEPIRTAIHRFKYLGEYQRGKDLGQRLAARVPELLTQTDQIDLVVPVPLHSRRHRQRGFNQATVLAEVLADAMDVPLVHALRRTRHTRSQTDLDPEERSINVAGAFEPVAQLSGSVTGMRALIVDDVTTTGATMAAAATALEDAGASTIIGLALAREG